MAAHTVQIPLRTLPANSSGPVGTATTTSSFTSATLTVDRTVPGGLNSLAGTAQVAAQFDLSTDGGSTWRTVSADTVWGGTLFDDDGQPVTTHTVVFAFNPPLARQTAARLTVTTPQAVAVQGSVTVTD